MAGSLWLGRGLSLAAISHYLQGQWQEPEAGGRPPWPSCMLRSLYPTIDGEEKIPLYRLRKSPGVGGARL